MKPAARGVRSAAARDTKQRMRIRRALLGTWLIFAMSLGAFAQPAPLETSGAPCGASLSMEDPGTAPVSRVPDRERDVDTPAVLDGCLERFVLGPEIARPPESTSETPWPPGRLIERPPIDSSRS